VISDGATETAVNYNVIYSTTRVISSFFASSAVEEPADLRR